MLEIKNIGKTYRKKSVQALQDVSLCFEETGMIFILGKSGSGKSTLLNILGGLDSCTQGEMFVEGKRINDFKTRDYDDYRNQYVGFVFQEFHLLEEYNVYENILLSLQLQHQKPNHQEIDALLTKLEIADLKDRKINELSGGQKQRVALARALIKKPKVILADEPTGNLDQKTGHEVMRLLQEISKDTLVIVVTHNEEYARMYGKRIIKLQDGKVVADTCPFYSNHDNGIYTVKRAKLPLKNIIKLSFNSLFSKKISFFISVFLISFSLVFLISAYSLCHYDPQQHVVQALQRNDLSMTEFRKFTNDSDGNRISLILKEKDVETIKQQTNQKLYPIYEMKNRNLGSVFHLNTYIQTDIVSGTADQTDDCYHELLLSLQIVEVDEDNHFITDKIIGHYPKEDHEIMISSYVADLMIEFGLVEYHSEKVYYPKNYEELVASHKRFYFGDENDCEIVGIINYDIQKYAELKNYTRLEVEGDLWHLDQELSQDKEKKFNKVYKKLGSVSKMKNADVIEVDGINNKMVFSFEGKLANSLNYIYQETEYYDGKTWKKISSLKDDEVLLSMYQILPNWLDYEAKLQNYLTSHSGKSKFELEKEFFVNYIDVQEYVGKTATLDIYEDTHIMVTPFKPPTKHYENLKVIGIVGFINSGNSQTLLASNILKKYQRNDFELKALLFDQLTTEDVPEVMRKFPYSNLYSVYNDATQEVERFYQESQKSFFDVVFWLSLGFSSLLISNIILRSIRTKKHDIGVLKALGTRNWDIIKVFLLEGVYLLSVVVIMASLVSKLFFEQLNYYFSVNFIGTSPFYLNLNMVLFLIIFLIAIISLSFLLPIFKMASMKPIDSINKRK